MQRKLLVLMCSALILMQASPPRLEAQGRPGARRANQGRASQRPRTPEKVTLSYGTDTLQRLDFYRAAGGNQPAPLVIFVHGGGWKRGSKENADGAWKAPHYTGLGYAYASINYRLVPRNTVEDQAADVSAALRYLIDRAARLGFDPTRVVIMGHSAGAHLVALVGTDERFLRNAGLTFSNLVGVLPIDGAAYDVPAQMRESGNLMQDTYLQAFGKDPTRQRALSPTLQAAAPNAPAFLILHVQRKDGVAQATELADALMRAGTSVERHGFPGTGLEGHAEINRQLGNPAYAATPVVDTWLKNRFEQKAQ